MKVFVPCLAIALALSPVSASAAPGVQRATADSSDSASLGGGDSLWFYLSIAVVAIAVVLLPKDDDAASS